MPYDPPSLEELRSLANGELLAHLTQVDSAIMAAKAELDPLAVALTVAFATKEVAEKALLTAKADVRNAKAVYDAKMRHISALGHLSRHIKVLLRNG